MPSADLLRSVAISRSARVMQIEGMFDVPPSQRSERVWKVSLPIEDRSWNIGLIVGPSGSGKTTVARELFGDHFCSGYNWPADLSIVDSFPAGMSIKDITGLLSRVGFSSPPSWLRPFSALSNGEQFRVTVARALAEAHDVVVIDEFTSVVDRTVARIGSAAVSKIVRLRKQQLIAVSCHYDIIDWLQPDWIYEPGTDSFQWRELQCRPAIEIAIQRVHPSAWEIFRIHHYLSQELARAASCFIGFIEGAPAAFTAVLPFPHAKRPGWREHRTVCLPDFQGVGIGNAVGEYVASLYGSTGKPYRSTTSHPAMIRYRLKSPNWIMKRAPSRTNRDGGLKIRHAVDRFTAGFEYVGKLRPASASTFGIKVKNEVRAGMVGVA